MLFHNKTFGGLTNALTESVFNDSRNFAGDPIPPPPTNLTMLITSDGKMIMTSDGNGIYMNNVDQ